MMHRNRGYFAIGVEHPKNQDNIGTLMRSAFCFDAGLMFTIGRRFPKQCTDNVKSWRHIPIIEYADVLDFEAHIPYACVPIGVELTDDARPLETFTHPERAIYLLGPEDGSLSKAAQAICRDIVQINVRYCLNLAVAGSILLYDRSMKAASICKESPVCKE